MDAKNSLTEGRIVSSLVRLSLPIILANLLQTAYQLADVFWLGRLGSEAVAAISLSFPILFFMISLGGGLTMAGTILVAQAKGRNNQKMVDYISAQTITWTVIVSMVFVVLGYLLSPWVVQTTAAAQEVFAPAVYYLRITCLGITFIFVYLSFQSLLRGVGDVKTPFYVVLGAVLLNIILDPLFIFGYGPLPAMGVGGAALATIISEGLASLIGMYIFLTGRCGIKLHLVELKPDWKLGRGILRLGLPVSIEQSMIALVMMVMVGLVSTLGTAPLAAYGIGGRVFSLVIIPALGLSMATSTMVGQNVGAGKFERITAIAKVSSLLGFVGLTALGIFLFVVARPLTEIFIPNEEATIILAAAFIKYMALTFGFVGIHQACSGALRGAGKTLSTMIITIVNLWVLRLPLAYIFAIYGGMGARGIWLSFPIVNITVALMAAGWLATGRWKKDAREISALGMVEEHLNSYFGNEVVE
ncbi:MAG: MATE family efflux transporter [Chlamydiota bacterium]